MFENPGHGPCEEVYCRFSVHDVSAGNGPQEDSFIASAECDMDGDGEIAELQADECEHAFRITGEEVY